MTQCHRHPPDDGGHAQPHRHVEPTGNGKRPSDGAEADLAALLELDATLLGGYLDDAAAWAAGHVTADPRLVVDLGAGTGIGALALARRFPGSAVVAVDRSRIMLDRAQAAAQDHGLADRISVVQADVDDGWPLRERADLVWASSSLHELREPARTLREVFGALGPGGLLVVVEMDSLPRFLPDHAGEGLEVRVLRELEAAGWNNHPDWTAHLQAAGFDVLGQRVLSAEAPASAPGAGRYADTYLHRMRAGVEGRLPADDLTALDRLLDPDAPEAVLHRSDLVIRSSRTAWAARRP